MHRSAGAKQIGITRPSNRITCSKRACLSILDIRLNHCEMRSNYYTNAGFSRGGSEFSACSDGEGEVSNLALAVNDCNGGKMLVLEPPEPLDESSPCTWTVKASGDLERDVEGADVLSSFGSVEEPSGWRTITIVEDA